MFPFRWRRNGKDFEWGTFEGGVPLIMVVVVKDSTVGVDNLYMIKGPR